LYQVNNTNDTILHFERKKNLHSLTTENGLLINQWFIILPSLIFWSLEGKDISIKSGEREPDILFLKKSKLLLVAAAGRTLVVMIMSMLLSLI
jgi:hypothetical protein